MREELSQNGFPKHLLDFALTPGFDGDSRTVGLLATAGHNVLSIDDDVILRAFRTNESVDSLAFAAHIECRSFGHFETREAAVRSLTSHDGDILASHERLLGRSLPSLLSEGGPLIDLTGCCDHMTTRLTNVDAKVLATQAGLVGDAGIQCPHRRLLDTTGPGYLLMTSSVEMCSLALRSRESSAIASRPTITHDVGFMTYCVGLSNNGTLPPFMPLGRNTDGLFGALLSRWTAFGLTAHIPVAVLHDSARAPMYPALKTVGSAAHTRVADLLIGIAQTRSPTGSRGVSEFGQVLTNFSTLPVKAFAEAIYGVAVDNCRREMAALERAIDDESRPKYWRDHAEQYLNARRALFRRPSRAVPIELRTKTSYPHSWESTRGFVRNFGEFLQMWSAVWCAAKEMDVVGPLRKSE
jgi:hypothetical protein